MGQLFELARVGTSEDTIALLRTLLEQAESGQLTGIAAVWFLPGRYCHGLAGSALRAPTFSRGALRSLDDALARIIDDRTRS